MCDNNVDLFYLYNVWRKPFPKICSLGVIALFLILYLTILRINYLSINSSLLGKHFYNNFIVWSIYYAKPHFIILDMTHFI